MDISLIQSGQNIINQQNEIIDIPKGISFSSTREDVKRGKWYYEGTFEEGYGQFLVGFKTQHGAIQFYPKSKSIWLNSDFNGSRHNEPLNITYPSNTKYVFGIGIDIDSNIFYIVYNNIVQTFHYVQQKYDSKYNMVLRGALVDKNINDKVSLNFGDKPFTYSLSKVLRAWNQPELINTIKIKNNLKFGIFCYITILI